MISHIALFTDSKLLGFDQSSISLYYVRELRKLKFIKYWRINIYLHENPTPFTILGEEGKVVDVFTEFDVRQYDSLETVAEKNLTITNLFYKGIMILADKFNWDKSIITEIRDNLIDANFKVEWTYKRKRNSAKEKVFAQTIISLEIDRNRFYVNFEKGGITFCSLLLFEGVPGFIYWDLLFKRTYWESPNVFVLANDKEDIFFKCTYSTCQFEVQFDLTHKSKQELECTMKTWQYGTSPEESQSLLFNTFPFLKEIESIRSAEMQKKGLT